MKVGVRVELDIETLPNQLDQLIEVGMDNCQLNSWQPDKWTDENAEYVKKLFKEKGITISAFWCGWTGPGEWNFIGGPRTLGIIPLEYREQRVKELCQGSDFAKKIGVTDVVTHMGFIHEDPNHPDFLPFCEAVKTIAEKCKSNGQYLLFETGQETPVAMLRCIETVGTGNLGVNLDTANLILYGKANPVDALDVFGKYVRNLHAKDGFYPTDGLHLGREVRIGSGKVDFYGVIKKLCELGYDSWITIEREISGPEQKKDVAFAKMYLDGIIEKVEMEAKLNA